jgi:hypothetical protein
MPPGSKASRGIRSNVKTFRLKQNVSGMAQNKAEAFLRPDQAVDIVNMHATEEGSWSADLVGYTKINSGGTAYESGAAVDGLNWWTDSSGTDHLMMAINGKLKEINTSTGAATDKDASAGYTVGGQVDFQAIGNKLFTCDGSIATPRKWDGSSAANSSGWPINDGSNTYTKPKFVENHNGRLAYANFQGGSGAASKYPSHVVIMDLDNAESCTLPAVSAADGYVVGVDDGDGQQITGMYSMHIPQSNDTQLIIFKNRKTYTLTGYSALLTDADQLGWFRMNGNYGAFNNRCIVEVGKDVLALSEFGITSYSASTDSGTIQPAAISSDLVKDVINRININVKEKCWGIHLPLRREVWFFLPTGASTQCNEAIVYKYPSPGDQGTSPKWSRRTDAGSKFKMAHGVQLNSTFYIGSYTGIVGTMFTNSLYDDVGIPWTYEYPYWDAGNEKQNKKFLNGDAHFKVRAPLNFTMTTKWKGGGSNEVFPQTLPIPTSIGGAKFGTGVFGMSVFGASEERKVAYECRGDGLRLKHKLTGVTSTCGPEFLGLTPVLELGNISQHWN